MNLYMTALSNIHTPPSTHTRWLTQSCQTCRQVDGTRSSRMLRGGVGWPILIQCLLYLEREGANGAFLTRLTLDQSHHTFSQGIPDFSLPPSRPPVSLPPTLRCICSLFHFYSVKGKREGEKKTRSTKVVLPAVNRGSGVRVEGGYR